MVILWSYYCVDGKQEFLSTLTLCLHHVFKSHEDVLNKCERSVKITYLIKDIQYPRTTLQINCFLCFVCSNTERDCLKKWQMYWFLYAKLLFNKMCVASPTFLLLTKRCFFKTTVFEKFFVWIVLKWVIYFKRKTE